MDVSQKCAYALKAILELSVRYGQGPVKTAEIASAHDMPVRFLEIILGELKQLGVVSSQRGARGGYVLALPPKAISVGQVVRFVESRSTTTDRRDGASHPVGADALFAALWQSVKQAVDQILDQTTFATLVEQYQMRQAQDAYNYMI